MSVCTFSLQSYANLVYIGCGGRTFDSYGQHVMKEMASILAEYSQLNVSCFKDSYPHMKDDNYFDMCQGPFSSDEIIACVESMASKRIFPEDVDDDVASSLRYNLLGQNDKDYATMSVLDGIITVLQYVLK